ncbi:hypothetical protein T484DRAFT_1893641, partial [Baffinella frigidus]
MEASTADGEGGSDAPVDASAAPGPSSDAAPAGDPQDAQPGEPGASSGSGRGRALSEENLLGAVLGAVRVRVHIPGVVVAAADAAGDGASAVGAAELGGGTAQQKAAGGGGAAEATVGAATAGRAHRPPLAPSVPEAAAAAAAATAAAEAAARSSASALRVAAAKAAAAAVPMWQNLPLEDGKPTEEFNIQSFFMAVSPTVPSHDFRLAQLWEWFDQPYGLEVPLVLKNIYYSISATSQHSPDADMPAFFVPHLSAIQ